MPFIVEGHEDDRDQDFRVTAPGPITDGVLDGSPVTIHLKTTGGRVSIEPVFVHE